ncbi:MAG: peptide-methionine (R)-S-oxide reductase, partial [Candidatus Aminicenantes bacterium]|nr:peptide-methionine (R)-S-oxide reductase [Candidatus Aminicenantes bacterium]
MKQKYFSSSLAFIFLSAIGLITACRQEIQSSRQISNGEKSMKKKIIHSDNEWEKILTAEQFRIMRRAGTERPFSGRYNDHYEKGTYLCAGCG